MGGGPGKPFSFEKSITFIILVISICEPALVYSKTKELGFCRNVRRGTGAVENYSFKEINAIIAPLASISLRIQTREFLTGNPRQEFVEMVEMNNEVIRELQEYLVRRGFKINIWEYSNYEWIFGEQNISEGLKVRSLYFDLSDPRVRELRGSKLFHRLLGSEVIDSGIEYSPIMGAIELWEAQAHPKLVRLDYSKGRVLLADQLESGLRHEGSHTALRLRRAKGKANGIFDLEFSDADGKLVDVNVYKKKFHGEEV